MAHRILKLIEGEYVEIEVVTGDYEARIYELAADGSILRAERIYSVRAAETPAPVVVETPAPITVSKAPAKKSKKAV
jgi:hypothetical protein